jgi:hypothetical protein
MVFASQTRPPKDVSPRPDAASPRPAYYGWRISLNGGQTWTVSGTNDCYTDFSGIPSGTLIMVEYNTTVKNVTSAWSSSETLLVK